MKVIKETTLHPEGNDGVDLYPKTNINQVQELPQKLTSVENRINQLNIDKLTKPTNPSAESAVTMLADGTVGTKPLSKIGGGGKLYLHNIHILCKRDSNLYINIINTSNTPIAENEYFKSIMVQGTVGYVNSDNGRGIVSVNIIPGLNTYKMDGVLVNNSNTPYYLNSSITFDSLSDTRIEL